MRFVARATLGQTYNLTIQTNLAEHAITGQEKTPFYTTTVFEVPQERFTLEASNGLYILLNYNFIAGDVLEIDYTTRSAILNGKNIDTAISIKSVFKELIPGQMEFVASHKSTVSYTERYY
ncbi:phage tail family protein [Virgibacillus sp. AGTR]|uniref:phage tail family protein n=1 Tax=Virgibacillus sp. AGTR TaxID=2812055 RepID=UPI001D164C36|nr:phage tail family protein [Virgibacillus sp. AGTR]MCC2248867.1 phage tail family protein [Virgibacillus sp. AGTR]